MISSNKYVQNRHKNNYCVRDKKAIDRVRAIAFFLIKNQKKTKKKQKKASNFSWNDYLSKSH